MDPDTESLLVSTCHALGGFEDRSERMDDASQVYVMGDECLGKKHMAKLISGIQLPAVLTLQTKDILTLDILPMTEPNRVFEGHQKVYQIL